MSEKNDKQEVKEVKNDAPIALTPEMLKALVEAIRKPIVTEKEQRDAANAAADRKANAELVLTQINQKKAVQAVCSHKHARGDSHAVYIQNGNFLLCQKCQAIIRSGVRPTQNADGTSYSGNDIFDTNLFNQLFQATSNADIID